MLAATYFSALLALVPLASASCGHGLDFIHKREVSEGKVAVSTFSYALSTGPLNWHNLAPANFLCGNGTNQSPVLINSTNVVLAPSGSIKLHVPKAHRVEFENLGTNVEVVINGTLEAAGEKWKLSQFHFHTPSEHRVDLAHFDAEWHFVFAAADGTPRTTVIAFFVNVDGDDTTDVLENIFGYLDDIQTPGQTTEVDEVDFSDFYDQIDGFDYYSYTGSLTTPPCTEGVSWFLATTPVPLSVNTYLKLKATTKTNNRYTQNSPGQENILPFSAHGL